MKLRNDATRLLPRFERKAQFHYETRLAGWRPVSIIPALRARAGSAPDVRMAIWSRCRQAICVCVCVCVNRVEYLPRGTGVNAVAGI